MAQVVLAENIDKSITDELFKFTIEMIDINTICLDFMNTETGVKYKSYIKKGSAWCIQNLFKLQNDFSQLYQMLNDCIFNKDSIFKYTLNEEKEILKFIIDMKNPTKFLGINLELILERNISENGLTDDRLNCLEYQFNKLREKCIKKFSEKSIEKENDIYKIYNEYNNLVYKGGMKNGKRHGKGKQYCPDTRMIIYDGYFKNGYYDGEGTLNYKTESGDIGSYTYWKGNFNKGVFNGDITTYIKSQNSEGYSIHCKELYENGYKSRIPHKIYDLDNLSQQSEEEEEERD